MEGRVLQGKLRQKDDKARKGYGGQRGRIGVKKKKKKKTEVKKKSRTGLEVKSELKGQHRGGNGVFLTSNCIEAIQGHIMHHFIKTEQMW